LNPQNLQFRPTPQASMAEHPKRTLTHGPLSTISGWISSRIELLRVHPCIFSAEHTIPLTLPLRFTASIAEKSTAHLPKGPDPQSGGQQMPVFSTHSQSELQPCVVLHLLHAMGLWRTGPALIEIETHWREVANAKSWRAVTRKTGGSPVRSTILSHTPAKGQ